jgi:delta14-sterol reductase
MLLNLGMASKQYQKLGCISGSMILVNIFQNFYIWDALYQERAILTTMDVTTDGFGFMLIFGDLAWVPFIYSLQARYLVNHDPGLSRIGLLAAEEVKHLTFMETKRGTMLIKWRGMARKINYTGDWIMGLPWCLLCGSKSIVPYFYAIYFFILLLHRSIRDDHACQDKYGEDWLEYKSWYRIVLFLVYCRYKLPPYRIIMNVNSQLY